MLDKLIEEIEKLQDGVNLLRSIFNMRDYIDLPHITVAKLEKYFNYDDSE